METLFFTLTMTGAIACVVVAVGAAVYMIGYKIWLEVSFYVEKKQCEKEEALIANILNTKADEYVNRGLITKEDRSNIQRSMSVKNFYSVVSTLREANRKEKIGLPDNLEFYTTISGE